MSNKLKFSAMSVIYIQYSFDYVLKSYSELGIDAIEFWAAEPHYYSNRFETREESLDYLNRLKNKLDDSKIKVSMFTPETLMYPYSYSHPEKKVRANTINYMKSACEEASILGCNKVFVNTGCGLRDIPIIESWKNCVNSYKEICDYAKTLNVNIVLEQLQPYESNLVTDLKSCMEMKKDVNRDNFKICLDLVAMEVANENIKDYFNVFGKDIVHIHLADRNHEILGEQDYPIESYLNFLEKVNFNEFVSLEINDSIYWEDPHKALYNSIKWLNEHEYFI